MRWTNRNIFPPLQSTNDSLERLDPLTEAYGVIALVGDQVDVVGHHNKAASEPIAALRAVEKKRGQTLESLLVIKNLRAIFDTDGQEIGYVPVVVGPHTMEPAQAAGRSNRSPEPANAP